MGLIKKYKQGNKITDSDKGFLNFALGKLYEDKDSKIDKNRVSEALNKYDPSNPQSLNSEYSDEELNWIQKANEEYKKFPVYKGSDAMEGFLNDKSLKTDHYLSDDKFLKYLADNHYGTKELESTLAELNKEGKAEQFIVDNFHKYLDNMKVDKRNIADVHKYKDYDLATTVDRNLDFRKLSSWLEHKTDGRLNLGSYTWTDDQKEQYRLEREADAMQRQQDVENEQNALDYGYYVDNLKNLGIDEGSSKFLWDNKFNRKTDYSDYFNKYLEDNNLHVFTNDNGLSILWGKAQDGATGLYTNKQYDNDYGKVFQIGSPFQDNPNFRPLSISDYNEETFGPAEDLIGYNTLPVDEYYSQVGSMDFNFNNKPDFLKDYQIRGTSGDDHRGSYQTDVFGMRDYMANLKLNKLSTGIEGEGDNAISVPVRGEDIELKRNNDGSYTFNGNTFRLSDFSYGDFNQDKLDSGYFLNNKMHGWWDRVDAKKPKASFLSSLTVQHTNPKERFEIELDKVSTQISKDFKELEESQAENRNPDVAEKKLKKSLSEFKYIFKHSYGKYGESVDKMLLDLWTNSNILLEASTEEGGKVFKDITARKNKKGGILYAKQGNYLSEAIRANRDLARPVNNTRQTTESAEPQLSGNTYKANIDGTGTVKESGVLDWISLGGSLASFIPVVGGFGGLVSTGAEAIRDSQDGLDGKFWGNLAANLGFTALAFAGLGAAKAGKTFKTGQAIVKSGKTAKALKGLNQTGKASKQLKLLGKSEQATKLSSLVSDVKKGKSALGVKNIASYVDKLEDTTKGVNEVAKAFNLGNVKNKAELVEKLGKQASIIEGLNKPITLSQSIGYGIKTAPVKAMRALIDNKSTIGKVVKTGLIGQAGIRGATSAFTIGKNIADEGSISKGLSKTQMSDLRSVLQAGMLGTQAGINRYRQNILFKNLDHTGGHQKVTVGKPVNIKGKQSSIGKETLTFKNNTNFDQFKEMSASKPDDIKKVTETLKKQLVNPNSVSDKDLKAFAKRLITSGISKQTTVGGKYGLKELSKNATPKEMAQHERARRWVEDTGFEYYSIPKWYRNRVLKLGPMVNKNVVKTAKVVSNPKHPYPVNQKPVNFNAKINGILNKFKPVNSGNIVPFKPVNNSNFKVPTTDGKGQFIIPGFEKPIKNRQGGILKGQQGLTSPYPTKSNYSWVSDAYNWLYRSNEPKEGSSFTFTSPYSTEPKSNSFYDAYNSLYRSKKPILRDRDLNLPDLYTGKPSIEGININTRFPTFNYRLKDITGSYKSFDYNEKPKSTNYWEVPVANTMSYLNTRDTNKQVRDLARSAINAGISKIDTVDAPTLRISDYSQGYVDKINHQTNSVLNRALKNTSDIGKTVQGIKDFTNTQNQALQDVYAQGQQRVDQLRSQNNFIIVQNESNRSQALNQNRASAADAASRIFMNEANYKAMQNESFKEFLGGMSMELEKNRGRKALDEITGQYGSDNYKNMQYNAKVYLENQKAIQEEIEEMNRINGTNIDYKTDSRYLQNEEDYKITQQEFKTWLADLNNKISLQKIRSGYTNPQIQTASKGGRLTVQERAYLEKIKYENKKSLDAQKLFYKQMQESNKELQKRLFKIFD